MARRICAGSHLLSVVIRTAVVLAATVTSGLGAEPSPGTPPFKIGDKVEFDLGTEVVQAEVVSVDAATGLVSVRYMRKGRPWTEGKPPDWLRPSSGAAAAPASPTKPPADTPAAKTGSAKPSPATKPKRGLKAGDNVEFDWGGETIRAQVVGLDPRTGAVRIRYQWQGREWNEVRPAAAFRPAGEKPAAGEQTPTAMRGFGPPAQGPAPFKVGDKVEFSQGPETIEAVVTAVNSTSGLVTIRYTFMGQELENQRPASWLRPRSTGGFARPGTAPRPEPAGAPLHVWTDSTGQHKTEAQFLELLADGQLRLKKPDGTVVKLPLAKLSEADQQYAQQLAKGGGEDPFGNAETKPAGDRGEPKAVTSADWSQVRLVVVDPSAPQRLAPDAATAPPLGTLRPIALQPPPGGGLEAGFFEFVSGLLLDATQRQILVVHGDRNPGGARPSRVERCDLREAKSLGSITLATAKVPRDLSPDGQLLVCLPNWVSPNGADQVEVWRLDRAGAEPVISWSTKQSTDGPPEPVDGALFLTPERLLTSAGWNGKLVVWDVKTARALYTLQGRGQCRPALSANRKQLAVTVDTGVFVLDPATGDTLAKVSAEPDYRSTIAFRADGRQLAVCSSERLRIFSLEQGGLVREIWFPSAMGGGSLDWIGADYVLVDRAYPRWTLTKSLADQGLARGTLDSSLPFGDAWRYFLCHQPASAG